MPGSQKHVARRSGLFMVVGVLLLWPTAPLAMGDLVVFTSDTTIAADNFDYEGDDIIVRGCTLTINGTHAFNSLTVERNAGNQAGVVTHAVAFADGFGLSVATDVFIQGADGSLVPSRIDVTGKGHGSASGPGAGENGTSWGAGAGYGGAGGSSDQATGGYPYGALSAPNDLGSGGGRGIGWSAGGAGGGAARLTVGGVLTVNGSLVANGSSGQGSANNGGGGGSGGSIYLTVAALAGTGVISADGGNGYNANYCGGGGGGRIAIYYDTNAFTGTHSAGGGAGYERGGAGTIFTKSSTQALGEMLIDNGGQTGATTPLVAGTYAFDGVTAVHQGRLDITANVDVTSTQLTIRDDGELIVGGLLHCPNPVIVQANGRLVVGGVGDIDFPHLVLASGGTLLLDKAETLPSMQIAAGGVLSHSTGQTGCHLTVTGDLVVETGGSISANGKGYASATGPGKGGHGSSYGGGGAYGGAGGDSTQAGGGSPYGSIVEPIDLGSGGGRTGYYYVGGTGGGALRLAVGGTFTVNGAITAGGGNGQGGGTYGGGGGSGGSIYLTVAALAGTGVISADGGNGYNANYCGGGGGGRIAIYYETNAFTGTQSSRGGAGYERGGAGTIFTKSSTQALGELLVDNGGQAGATTPLVAGTYAFDDVTAVHQGRLDITADVDVTSTQLTIRDDGELIVAGLLHCPNPVIVQANGRMVVGGVGDIDFPHLVLASGGTLLLDKAETLPSMQVAAGGVLSHSTGQTGFHLTVTGDLVVETGGSISANGKGYGSATGPGKGADGSSYGAGGGYGGAGGNSTQANGGATYGLITEPIDLGSGGGKGSTYEGGAGGGALRVTVNGALTVNGSVTANGTPGVTLGGGGSGGSIYLTVGTLTGGGIITANGGNAGNTSYSGGGGGGRIAVYHYLGMAAFPTANIHADGGTGYQSGQPGTIWLRYARPYVLSHSPIDVANEAIDHVDVTFSERMAVSTFGVSDVLLTSPTGDTIPVNSPQPLNPNENEWRVSFSPQTAQGRYHLYVGPHIQDADGNEMDQDLDGTAGEDPTPANPPYTDLGDVYAGTVRIRLPTLYIDDDAPNDPGPGDPTVSDPEEDGSPDHPFDAIQEAIDFALPGDTLVVATGTYFEHLSFGGKQLVVTGTDPPDPEVTEDTVVDGSRSGAVVSFTQGETRQSVLTGLTIANGRAAYGGGIYVNDASPSIVGNIITDNRADTLGAGIYCSNSQALVCGNHIVSNFGAGLACSAASSVPTIERNVITDNWLRGVHCVSSAHPTVRNNVIAWNYGEGLKCESAATPQIINCTIAHNDVTGVLASGATPTIRNCVLWENYDDLSGCTATYSIVQDSDLGQGNIPYAPHFVNSWTDDFHLRSWSLAINAGDPGYSPEPGETDMDGNERILLGLVDMGAYESPVDSADTDADGLADDWEQWFWGNLNHTEVGDEEPDGISNLGEYLFGRSPEAVNTEPPAIMMVQWAPSGIDVGAGENAEVTYLLDRHADVTIHFYHGGTNQIVRTVANAEFQSAGPSAVIWDGHGDPNDPLAPDPPAMGEGAYYFQIFATDLQGHPGQWLKLANTVPSSYSAWVDATNFDPWLNDFVEIGFTLSASGYEPLTIQRSSDGATIRNMSPFGAATTPRIARWDGRDNNGNIFAGGFSVYFAVPVGVPGNSIIVTNDVVGIDDFACEAYVIVPSYGEVSLIRYTLSSAAEVSVAVNDPDGNHFATILDHAAQAAGPQEIVWDGRNDAGRLIWTEGDYTVTISATDTVTGTSVTRAGVIMAYR